MKLKLTSALALLILTASLGGCLPWDEALEQSRDNAVKIGEVQTEVADAVEQGMITKLMGASLTKRLDDVEADNTEIIEDAEAAEEEDIVGDVLRIAGMAGLPGMPLIAGFWDMSRRRKNKAVSLAKQATQLAEGIVRSIKISTDKDTGVVDWKRVASIQSHVKIEDQVEAILLKHKKTMAEKDMSEGNGVEH